MKTQILTLADLIQLHNAGELVGLFAVEESAYHAGPGISRSTLQNFKLSPAHAKRAMTEKKEPTSAMEFGTAFHCATLEPVRFDATYVAAPKIDKRTTAGKAAFASWESENQGKTVIDSDDLATVLAMRDQVRGHEVASRLTNGIIEMAAYWIDEETGILCKCKPDAIVGDEGVILDVKSTKDSATEKDFLKSVGNYAYHVQAAFYLDGVREALKQSIGQSVGLQSAPGRFVFLVVEKGAPHGVDLFELDEEDIAVGRALYRKYLQEMAICQMENHWPSYPRGIKKLGRLPAWAL